MTADNIGDIFGMLAVGLASIPAYRATKLIYKIRWYTVNFGNIISKDEPDLQKIRELRLQHLLSKKDSWSIIDTACLVGSIVSGFLSSFIPFISSFP